MDGQRIVKLPNQIIKRYTAHFDKVEAEIYQVLLSPLKTDFQAYKDTKSFKEVLATITRIIQCTCGPRLL